MSPLTPRALAAACYLRICAGVHADKPLASVARANALSLDQLAEIGAYFRELRNAKPDPLALIAEHGLRDLYFGKRA